MNPATAEWLAKAEADFGTMTREAQVKENANYDDVCFHAQQCAEKYLKARLCEAGTAFPRTHDLTALLALVTAAEPGWQAHEEDLAYLTDFGVFFRYPGESADRDMAEEAQRRCRSFRDTARESFGLCQADEAP
ncbi:MAG TPA: HEPN domain-containing protein [Phycisphaerae bacterium]|nr:HEPN domain-containing protein [Phycisphaerae bacterium]